MKSNFFVLSSGANLERHTHTGFRFMSVFRKYPTSTANFIYIGVVRGTYFTANQILACKNTVKNFWSYHWGCWRWLNKRTLLQRIKREGYITVFTEQPTGLRSFTYKVSWSLTKTVQNWSVWKPGILSVWITVESYELLTKATPIYFWEMKLNLQSSDHFINPVTDCLNISELIGSNSKSWLKDQTQHTGIGNEYMYYKN